VEAEKSTPDRGQDTLKRQLGLFELVTMAIGGMIGGSIFVSIGVAVGMTGPSVPISFAVTAFLALLIGYSYSKLGPRYPEAGGSFSYISMAFHNRRVRIIVGYSVWFAYIAACALYVVGFAHYAAVLLPLPQPLLIAMIVIPFTLLNVWGVKESARTQSVMVISKLAILMFFVVAGFFFIDTSNFDPLFPNGEFMVFMAVSVIFLGYQGFDIIGTAAEELRDPQRNIRRAIYISIAVVSIVYILVSLVTVGVMNWEELANADGEAPLVTIAEKTLGETGILVLSIGGVLSTASAFNAASFGASRIAYTLGRYQLMPKQFARLLHSRRTPHMALIYASTICAAIAIFGLFSPSGLATVASLSSSAFMVIFLMVTISSYRLRRETGSNPKILLFTIIMFVFVIVASIMADVTSWCLLLGWVVLIFVLDVLMRYFRVGWFIFRKRDLR